MSGYPFSPTTKRLTFSRAYFVLITVIFLALVFATSQPIRHWPLVVLTAIFITTLEFSLARFSTAALSLTSAIVFASSINIGLFQTSLSLLLAMVLLVVRSRKGDPLAAAFNISQYGLSGTVGLWAYTSAGGAIGYYQGHLLALVLYAGAYLITNFIVTMLALSLHSRSSWREMLQGNGFFFTSYIVEMALGAVGGILFQLYGVVALVVVFIVLWVVLLTYKRLVDMTYAAETDDLTELLNRKAFQQRILPVMRRGDSASLLVIDLDHFKKVNDASGHQNGDKVLQEMAQIIQKAVGPSDIVSRYGGEEFCILMSTDDGVTFAEQLRQSIERHEFSVSEKPHLTVSIGVATYPKDATDWEGLFECADRALYEAKRVRNSAIEYSSLLAQINC